MKLDLLWTDYCFLVVLALSIVVIIHALRKEPIRHSCADIFSRPIAVSAAIILLFFLVIAVLDSVHYQLTSQDNHGSHTTLLESHSLLDELLAPLGAVYEKTYSAPLALNLYTTEIDIDHDTVEQIYPRLNYVPSDIQNDQDKWRILLHALNQAVGYSFLIVAGIWLLFAGVRHRFSTLRPNRVVISALVTLFVCLVVSLVCYWVSRIRTLC